DEGMEDSRVPFAVDLALEDPVDDEVLHAGGDVIPPSLAALGEEEVPDPEVQLAAEHRETDDQKKRHRDGVAGGKDHARGSEGAVPSSTRGSRLFEGQDDAVGILLPDAMGHASDVRFGVDLVIRLDRKGPNLGIRSDDDEHDLRGMLLEEPREPIDRGSCRRRHRLHKEQAATATRDDGGRKPGVTFRTASRSRVAASFQPRYSNIITPASISAVGFTLFRPAYFGALPWTGSKTACASPMFPPAATPRPPICAAAASLR